MIEFVKNVRGSVISYIYKSKCIYLAANSYRIRELHIIYIDALYCGCVLHSVV